MLLGCRLNFRRLYRVCGGRLTAGTKENSDGDVTTRSSLVLSDSPVHGKIYFKKHKQTHTHLPTALLTKSLRSISLLTYHLII